MSAGVCSRCYRFQYGKFCEGCGGDVCSALKCTKCHFINTSEGVRNCVKCGGKLLKSLAVNTHGSADTLAVKPSDIFNPKDDALSKYRISDPDQPKEDRSSIEIRPPALQSAPQQQQQQNPPRSYGATVNPSDVLRARTDDGLAKYRIDPNAAPQQAEQRTSIEIRPPTIQPAPQQQQPRYGATVNPSDVLRARTDDGLAKYRIPDSQGAAPTSTAAPVQHSEQRNNSQTQYHQSQPQQLQPAARRGPTVSPSEVLKARTDDGLAKYRIDPSAAPQSSNPIPQSQNQQIESRPTVFQARGSAGISVGGVPEDNTWQIHLFNLPSGPGQPVRLSIQGHLVFSSEGNHGHVTSVVSSPIDTRYVGKTEFVLDLAAVSFQLKRELAPASGRFVKFEATPGGMKFVQQEDPL